MAGDRRKSIPSLEKLSLHPPSQFSFESTTQILCLVGPNFFEFRLNLLALLTWMLFIESKLYGSWIADRVARPAGPAPTMQMSHLFFLFPFAIMD